MNRGLWFVAGAGAGIWAVVRGRRAAEALTVDGLQDRMNGLAVGLRMFRDEVAQGKAEAETGLRERLSPAPHGRPELAPGPGQPTAARAAAPTAGPSEEEEGRS